MFIHQTVRRNRSEFKIIRKSPLCINENIKSRYITYIQPSFPKPQIHSKYLKQKRPIRIPLYLKSEIFVCLLCLPCTVKCGEHYFIHTYIFKPKTTVTKNSWMFIKRVNHNRKQSPLVQAIVPYYPKEQYL